MYTWFVFLHLVGILLFVIAHGVSASVSFQVRRERNLDRLRALAELSATSYPLTYGGLLLLLVSGIITGFMGHWWGSGWIWVSIIVLIAIICRHGEVWVKLFQPLAQGSWLTLSRRK